MRVRQGMCCVRLRLRRRLQDEFHQADDCIAYLQRITLLVFAIRNVSTHHIDSGRLLLTFVDRSCLPLHSSPGWLTILGHLSRQTFSL